VMIASPEILAPIRRAMPLFNLNVVAVAALRAAIADPSFREWYIGQANESKRLVYAACERAGLKYWKSSANFVLIDGGARLREIVDGMIAKGVFVRDRSKDPATPTCFRLTTGVVEHTRKACDTLEALCARLR
jgi:histidinol-phosphate aminotransferase